MSKRKKDVKALQVTQRRQRLIELASQGFTDEAAAKVIGASVSTVQRDWRTIRSESTETQRAKFAAELEEMKRFILEEARVTDKALVELWLGVADRLAKLFGWNAPTKSIVGHQDLNHGLMYEFLEHSYGLSDDWVRVNIFPILDAQPRQSIKPDFSGFSEQLGANNENHS